MPRHESPGGAVLNRVLTGRLGLGLNCLVVSPILVMVMTSALLDMIVVGLGLLGIALLIAAGIIRSLQW
jgi:hypothetical protein